MHVGVQALKFEVFSCCCLNQGSFFFNVARSFWECMGGEGRRKGNSLTDHYLCLESKWLNQGVKVKCELL